MTEPSFFGIPLSFLFLYFIVYSFLGWIMETTYCSILEKRFVVRGFLYGPICPIYGVGVLMMICWFTPLVGHPFFFYVTATVVMSAWESFVGWFLEATTHIKYWDYSMYRFNLHGRICLWVSLTWGVLAYVVIFWIHPAVAGVLALIPPLVRYILDGVLAALLAADVVVTIRQLMLITKLLSRLNTLSEELQLQLTLGRAELSDRLDSAREDLSDRLDSAKEGLSDRLSAVREAGELARSASRDTVESLRIRYNELLAKAERQSRHLRYVYRDMTSRDWGDVLSQVKEQGRTLKERLRQAARDRKNQR